MGASETGQVTYPISAPIRRQSGRPAMTIELDHVIVSAEASAFRKRLANCWVRWAETGAGPFSPVYVNDG